VPDQQNPHAGCDATIEQLKSHARALKERRKQDRAEIAALEAQKTALAEALRKAEAELTGSRALAADLTVQLADQKRATGNYRGGMAEIGRQRDRYQDLAERLTRQLDQPHGDEPEPPAQWGLVEVMGHRVTVGQVTECPVADTVFLHVERPDGRVQLVPPASVYMITDVSEAEAAGVHKAESAWGRHYGLPAALSHVLDEAQAGDRVAARPDGTPYDAGDGTEPERHVSDVEGDGSFAYGDGDEVSDRGPF